MLKDNDKKKGLNKELSEKKTEKMKCINKLKHDGKLVKKIILIFKSKTEKTSKNRFRELYDKLDDIQEEIESSWKTYPNTWIK